ncbi:type I-E CRISPR-associated protein Cas6/Cse3/CasE [Breoghania sp.]|uniref:type I-E CRISPR-associated protein Cas6/Cse3/CasE n=1 Tax=Breoghania sp. TaxID=2065378 RepID=UPI0029CA3906|nr:type I-E CRISPR-associated protein Cas6/Cse3/CasE [Breoghania sp.]
MTALHMSRLTLRRDSSAVAPLIDVLRPRATGEQMNLDHKLLWTVMPEAIRAGRETVGEDSGGRTSAFLWRRDSGSDRFYLLGPRPETNSPFFDVETKPFEPVLAAGDRLAFDLRVNATVNRRIAVDAAGKAVRQRCDIAMDLMAREKKRLGGGENWYGENRERLAEEAAREWFARQGEANGFAVAALALDGYRTQTMPRGRGRPARFGVLDLKGIVTVIDPVAFTRRLAAGFGRAKAFGCGLMLIRRIS